MSTVIQAHLTEARQAHTEGRERDSRNAYARAAALSRETRHPLLQAKALRHLAQIDREGGRVRDALSHAEQAAALYRETPEADPGDLANALRLVALALDDLGRRERADIVWAEALDAYRLAGVAAGVAECESRLGA